MAVRRGQCDPQSDVDMVNIPLARAIILTESLPRGPEPMPVIKPADFDDDRVKALLTRHLEGMHANSPPGHVFALKELEPRAGEIKSMRTADAHLRRGVAATILDHIITQAHQRGYARLSLETGSGAAFEPALKLYRKYGFTDGGAFGDYVKSPFNQFLHLELGS